MGFFLSALIVLVCISYIFGIISGWYFHKKIIAAQQTKTGTSRCKECEDTLYDELGREIGTIKVLCVCNPSVDINKQKRNESIVAEPDYGIGLYNKTVIPIVYEESLNGWQIWEIGTQLLHRYIFNQGIKNGIM